MTNFSSFRSVIELWPTRDALANDLGATPPQVSKWWQRDNIPSEWWSRLIATPCAERAGVSATILAGIAARSLAVDRVLSEARA